MFWFPVFFFLPLLSCSVFSVSIWSTVSVQNPSQVSCTPPEALSSLLPSANVDVFFWSKWSEDYRANANSKLVLHFPKGNSQTWSNVFSDRDGAGCSWLWLPSLSLWSVSGSEGNATLEAWYDGERIHQSSFMILAPKSSALTIATIVSIDESSIPRSSCSPEPAAVTSLRPAKDLNVFFWSSWSAEYRANTDITVSVTMTSTGRKESWGEPAPASNGAGCRWISMSSWALWNSLGEGNATIETSVDGVRLHTTSLTIDKPLAD